MSLISPKRLCRNVHRLWFRIMPLLGVALLVCVRTLDAQPSSVILVRHAEKAAVAGDDPPLSELGTARATDLATALRASMPSAVIVSSRQRTALTAADVAKMSGITPTVVSLEGGGAAHIAAVAKAVQQATGVVLVVGHSNTIPAVIKALGGPSLPDICDATYSHLFVMTPARDGKPATLVMSRYGATEGPVPTSCVGMIPK
jgi:phosphohistidine phosphatase SixA